MTYTKQFGNGYSVCVKPNGDGTTNIDFWPTRNAVDVETYERIADSDVERIVNDIECFNAYMSWDDISRMEYEKDRQW